MTGLIKRSAMSLIVTAAFCVLAFAIVRPLMAYIVFSKGESLIRRYQWPQADMEMRRAIALDPLNASYYSKLGDFIFAQSTYAGYKKPSLAEAERFYKRAIELDPLNADYRFALGKIKLAAKEYGNAFRSFRAASALDPHGYIIAYGTGMAGLGVWKKIGDDDRDFVIDRLKVALQARPYESDRIYGTVWGATKDFSFLESMTPPSYDGQNNLLRFLVAKDLWQFRKTQIGNVSRYSTVTPEGAKAVEAAKSSRLEKVKGAYLQRAGGDKSVAASDWTGTTPDGKYAYDNGNMYWSGTIDAAVDVPAGKAVLKIRAKGQPADGVYPYMIVELDGKEIGGAFVDSADWKEYEFKTDSEGGVRVISVTFTNDAYSEKGDRNLFIDGAEVIKSGG